VAFRAKFWNIGAEGQLMAGAIAAAYVGQRAFLPEFSLVPLMILGAAILGAFWALIPALLKVHLRVDDVVTTLLLNFIMLYGVTALLEGPWRDPASGYPNSPSIRPEAEFPILPGIGVHLGILLAFLAAIGIWWMLTRTTLGFRIRAVGHNPVAANYAGMSVGRTIVVAALLSGALAGLAGAGEVGGVRYQVTSDLSSGYGYAGIVIATLAELNPLGAVPAALFFAIIFNGAGSMARATGVPVYLADVIQGVALVCMVAGRSLRFTGCGWCARPRLPSREGRRSGVIETLGLVLDVSFFVALVRIATPLLLATTGELISERAGVLNLGIEGIMLLGAMVGFTAAYHSGNL
jgi:simple sugar transport system permease protein